ncbi:MAG TPA: glycerol-3-phosphate 1-O-acyltransferase PlsY [Candidatus Mcinerneyibacteriales bacterium]|nr:glycerol-3-phosphate 1-O-acyltransferase PlsY [Candidatus Mcinerneyibacteriales bacterium]HPQ90200.1 glycerol-3-phosphate 1-O-acyltransferase PlsY [Candidatus Mcinerneyibacteriales bacterium]
MEILLIAVLSYLIGSVPFAYIIVKLFSGKDIRRFGSGNVGATNAYRIVGLPLAVVTFLLDFLKGFAVVTWLAPALKEGSTALITGALFVLLGHMFTCFLRFKGGKGAATGLGVVTALSPLGALTAIILWVVIVKASRMVSLATMIAALSASILSFLFYPEKREINIFLAAMVLLVILRHWKNIVRICHGTENKV